VRQQILGVAQGNAAAVITLQYPESAEPLVKKITDSVKLLPGEPLDAFALAGLNVADQAGLQVSGRVSTPVLFTEPGVKPPLNGAPSLALLSIPYPHPNLSDEELGQMLGGALKRYEPDPQKVKEGELKIGPCPAYTLTAPGSDQGKPAIVLGMIARCPDGALLGIGVVRPADAKKYLPRFDKIIRSITLDNTVFLQVAAKPQPTSQKLP
jgi:hypothetical protein